MFFWEILWPGLFDERSILEGDFQLPPEVAFVHQAHINAFAPPASTDWHAYEWQPGDVVRHFAGCPYHERECHDMMVQTAEFTADRWNPDGQAYGILHLLRWRAEAYATASQDFASKPAEVAHLKFIRAPQAAAEEGIDPGADSNVDGQTADSEEVPGFGHAGAWWRVMGPTDAVVRKGASMWSDILRTEKPDAYLLQADTAQRLIGSTTSASGVWCAYPWSPTVG